MVLVMLITAISIGTSRKWVAVHHTNANVRNINKAVETVAATVAHFGRLDVLVANAATLRPVF
jgi:NAD(P)-dependent dehydrogenase (short-subunit alcohol dehydrogenase family)